MRYFTDGIRLYEEIVGEQGRRGPAVTLRNVVSGVALVVFPDELERDWREIMPAAEWCER